MPRSIRIVLLVSLIVAGVLAPGPAAAATPAPDPALCNPVFAAFARQHPADWERITDPAIRPMIGWQRLIGCHAWVIGWADEQPNPTYTHPRVVIDVTHWDHADLFTLGLPHVYDGKPVVLHEESAIPDAAGATALPARLPAAGAGGASDAAPHPYGGPAPGYRIEFATRRRSARLRPRPRRRARR